MQHLPVHFCIPMINTRPLIVPVAGALTGLHRDRLRPTGFSGPSRVTLTRYSQAIVSLRTALASSEEPVSDATLLATAVLGMIEGLMHHPQRIKAMSAAASLLHYAGSSAIMLAQKRSTAVSRSIMYNFVGMSTFVQPCFGGKPSPFEQTHWVDADPPNVTPGTCEAPELRRLQKTAHQLFILLPRLVCLIRSLQERTDYCETIRKAQELANGLDKCKDDAAENWLLHHISIVPTSDTGAAKFIPYSYSLESFEEVNIGLQYWQTRLILVALHIRALSMGTQTSLGEGAVFLETLAKERRRLAKCILMSAQHASNPGTTANVFGSVAAWAAVKQERDVRGVPSSVVGEWIRKNIGKDVNGWMVGSTMSDLSAAAEVVVGGPVSGYMATLFGGPQAVARRSGAA